MPEDAVGIVEKEIVVEEAPGDLFDAPDNAVLIRRYTLLIWAGVYGLLMNIFQMHVIVSAPGALVSQSSSSPR
jgi:hypothetical protein